MKRFTETEKWRDPWFQKLDIQTRTLWLWLCDRVDNAGVVDICWPICNAETTGSFNHESMELLGDRVEKLENGKWWIPRFVEFQFGKLSSHSKVHQSIENLLSKHSLSHRVTHRVYDTPKEKDKDKDKEKDKEKRKDKKKEMVYSKDFLSFYDMYPRKEAKGEAYQAWLSHGFDSIMVNVICESLKRQLPSLSRTEMKYIKLPATWLNKRCWEDETDRNYKPKEEPMKNDGIFR